MFTTDYFKMPRDLPPGPVNEAADSLSLPAILPPGEYVLSAGVIGVNNQAPVVRLAIQGRADDGWYPLSQIRIVPSGLLESATACRGNVT